MEDRDEKKGTEPETEAHRAKRTLRANEEAPSEDKEQEEQEVEAHRFKKK